MIRVIFSLCLRPIFSSIADKFDEIFHIPTDDDVNFDTAKAVTAETLLSWGPMIVINNFFI